MLCVFECQLLQEQARRQPLVQKPVFFLLACRGRLKKRSKDFYGLVTSFKSSSTQHDVHFVNYGPIYFEIDDKAGHVLVLNP